MKKRHMKYSYVAALMLLSSPLCSSPSIESLSLQGAEEIALECNKHFLIAKEQTFQGKERKLQAVSRFLPKLGYYGEFRETQKPEIFFNVYKLAFPFSNQGYVSALQVDQPIFSSDLVFGFKAREYEADALSYDQANTKNELLLGIRKHYYAVVFYEKALEIERENIDYFAYALEQEQQKLEAGSSTPFEVNQSKVAVANAISLYYLTLKELKNSRNALIGTLGIDPLLEPKMHILEREIPLGAIGLIGDKIKKVEKRYDYPSDVFPDAINFMAHISGIESARNLTLFSEQEVLDYLDEALSFRPDLKSRKLQIDAAEQNLRSKQGHYLPKIGGYVRYAYNDGVMGYTPFQHEQYFFTGGIQLSWNLFDSFLREHEIKEARSQRQQSRIQFDRELQRIEIEIRNGLYQVEEALLAYLSAAQAVLLAEQARLQAQEKLEAGRIAPLEYRDSVNLLSQARNQKNRASFELISSYYQLRYSTGIDAKGN